MNKPISERLTPDMTRALRLGWGERGATVQGLVRRRLARPGSDTNRLRMTPMGQQWARALMLLADVHTTLGVARELMHIDDAHAKEADKMVQACMTEIGRHLWP